MDQDEEGQPHDKMTHEQEEVPDIAAEDDGMAAIPPVLAAELAPVEVES